MASTPTPPDDTPPPWNGPDADPSKVIQWIGYHLGELFVVGVLIVPAVTVDAWLTVLPVLAAGVWGANEVRQHRKRQALAAAVTGRRTVTASPAESDQDSTDRTEATA